MLEEIEEKIGLFIGDEGKYNEFVKKYHYVQFLNCQYSIDEMEKVVIESGAQVLFAFAEDNWYINRLLWSCDNVETVCVVNGNNPYITEQNKNRMANARMWDYIAVNSNSNIEAGGWYNSYSGLPFSEQEMKEFADDVYIKLKEYIDESKTILEIGCASGITMYRLAPYCRQYIGTDMAAVNLKKNQEYIEKNNIHNICLFQCEANQVGKVCQQPVNIVIINSVVQYFPGINYLKQVVEAACQLISQIPEGGIVYIGDVMDLDKKNGLYESLIEYKKAHPEAKTKQNLSEELFLPRHFFYYLQGLIPEVSEVIISDKEGRTNNELLSYRYDVILKINTFNKGVNKKILKKQMAYNFFDD